MADDGGFGRFIDAATVEYERVFSHPIERVWRAITEPEEIERWFEPLVLDLKAGGGWRLGDGVGGWAGAITALEPPRLIRFGHGPGMFGGETGYFQYQLTPVADGTRMLFTQHFPDVPGGLARDPDGVAGGWHELFDSLAEWLGGHAVGERLPQTDLTGTVSGWAQRRVSDGDFDEATARRYVLDMRREEVVAGLNRQYRQRAAAGLAGQADGGLARFIDRWTMEYVRVYPHPIERVWRAISDPAELAAWFITPSKWELEVGGAYRMHDDGFSGKILAVEPPTRLRLGNSAGDSGYTEYQLSEVAGGTRMRFINHFAPDGVYAVSPDLGGDLPGGPGTPWKPGFVGGYHEFWDDLGDFLDGVPQGSRLPQTEMSRVVQEWADQADVFEYGLSEAQLARIVRGLRGKERWNELNEIYRAHIAATIPPA